MYGHISNQRNVHYNRDTRLKPLNNFKRILILITICYGFCENDTLLVAMLNFYFGYLC